MKSEDAVDTWRAFYEAETVRDPSYKQQIWESFWSLKIQKGTGGDKQQTQAEIRAIPGVTIVAKDGELKNTGSGYQGIFKIKFALVRGENKNKYVKETLFPGLRSVKGLKVLGLQTVKRVK